MFPVVENLCCSVSCSETTVCAREGEVSDFLQDDGGKVTCFPPAIRNKTVDIIVPRGPSPAGKWVFNFLEGIYIKNKVTQKKTISYKIKK